MKSAYELAMERLQKADPDSAKSLSEEQKEALAKLDRDYSAKIAEREIFLRKQLDDALRKGEQAEAERIRTQMANERTRLHEEREEKKERVRREAT